jgi:hypothetical protein
MNSIVKIGVIPAEAGIHKHNGVYIPAFAGMTIPL